MFALLLQNGKITKGNFLPVFLYVTINGENIELDNQLMFTGINGARKRIL